MWEVEFCIVGTWVFWFYRDSLYHAQEDLVAACERDDTFTNSPKITAFRIKYRGPRL